MSGPLYIVDGFAGGGGVSIALRNATGQDVTVAFNHDEAAIRMHEANHPHTLHYCDDAYDLWPPQVTGGRSPDISWFSPDCTHFSRAAGRKPREQRIRGLPWMVVTWARTVRPRLIFMENVNEIRSWGPLDAEGYPIPARQGETWRDFLLQLARLGYNVEVETLCAADYGDRTSRRRLFMVARCDGLPICWPEKTHGPGRAQPWGPAAECIDWSVPMRSIFGRKKPLADKTLKRIAEGIRRYVLETAEPFLLCLTHGGRLEPLSEPLRTTTTANRGERALVTAQIAKHYSGAVGQDLRRPLGTVTAVDHHSLVTAFLARANSHGWDANGSDVRSIGRPAWTVTGKNDMALAAATLITQTTGSAPADIRTPLRTITSSGNQALVAAFFCQYYGSGGQWASLSEPMRTVVSKARTGLVTVTLQGQEYVLTDIAMRMLQPHELAKAHSLEEAILTGTKTEQIKRIGNSVPRHVAEALIRANLHNAVPLARAA